MKTSKRSPKVFVSYAHADRDQVNWIEKWLGNMNVRSASDASILSGKKWEKQLREALKSSDYVIACISPNYLSSAWMNFELGTALGRGSKVVPLLLRPTAVPNVLKRFQLIDAGKDSVDTVREQLKEALQLQ